MLARNVHAGRSELDIVAVDPGPPERLVVVEVRWRASRSFGGAEESDGLPTLDAKHEMIRLLVQAGTAIPLDDARTFELLAAIAELRGEDVAFSMLGAECEVQPGLVFELIQPLEGDSIHRDWLAERGVTDGRERNRRAHAGSPRIVV